MKKALAEGIYVALQMRKPIPLGAKDAFVIIETGCRPTVEEIDGLPDKTVDAILLYGSVKSAIETGGTLII